MCGVAGLICLDPLCNGETHASVVTRMCEVQFHRGPDDGGVATLGPACLGARRLSIIDLSEAGHMPMSDASGRWWITYNGEVYNFRELRRELEARCHSFHSLTDTEVVLHAYMEWGERCLERFVGMFAFGIYDRETGRLVLGRDRYGIKPLYYARRQDHVLFASEAKALTAAMSSAAIDHRRVIEWFLYRNIDALSPDTLLEGVTSVMPGCVVTVSADGIDTKRIYRLPSFVSAAECRHLAELSPERVVDEVDMTLSEAVRLRLISDVPVGTLLSGGLDSSLITALAARETSSLTAFNVSVAGYADLDERKYAEALAETLRIPLVCFEFTADTFRDHLVRAVQLSDFPLSHPNSIAYHMISRAAREHGVIVLLSGEGADELFGGYAWAYRRRWYLERLRPLFDRVPQRLWSIAALLTFAKFDLPVTSSGFRDLLPSTVDLIDRYDRLGWRAECEEAYAFVAKRADRALFGALLAELHDFLSPLLRRLDRMSMGASVEVRVPFLDHRLVHLAINLPIEYRIGAFSDKWVLRQVAARHLPLQFARRKKMGFPLPLADYLAPFADRRFFDGGFCAEQLSLNRRGLDRLVSAPRQRALALFGMVTFEIWGRLHIRRDPVERVQEWVAGFGRAA